MELPRESSAFRLLTSLAIHGDVGNYSTQLSLILLVSDRSSPFGHPRSNRIGLSDGVRAGAKRLGRKKELSPTQRDLCVQYSLSGRLSVPFLFGVY